MHICAAAANLLLGPQNIIKQSLPKLEFDFGSGACIDASLVCGNNALVQVGPALADLDVASMWYHAIDVL